MPEIQGNAVGLTAMSAFDSPRRIEINEVNNGYTISLIGGKVEKSIPFRHNIHVSNSIEEVVALVQKHLAV